MPDELPAPEFPAVAETVSDTDHPDTVGKHTDIKAETKGDDARILEEAEKAEDRPETSLFSNNPDV